MLSRPLWELRHAQVSIILSSRPLKRAGGGLVTGNGLLRGHEHLGMDSRLETDRADSAGRHRCLYVVSNLYERRIDPAAHPV